MVHKVNIICVSCRKYYPKPPGVHSMKPFYCKNCGGDEYGGRK